MVEINRLVREVLRMVEGDLHGHGVSVSTEFQEDIPQVRADPIQLQQVILNLVRNAIDAIGGWSSNQKGYSIDNDLWRKIGRLDLCPRYRTGNHSRQRTPDI